MITNFEEITRIEDNHERIIILRKRLGKSQYQFAKDLGISSSYLGQLENYKVPFTKQLKERINDYLSKEKQRDAENIFSHFK